MMYAGSKLTLVNKCGFTKVSNLSLACNLCVNVLGL